jgi:hypothetical protein
VINGITGETFYLEYPLKEFQYSRNRLFIRIGDSVFTREFCFINISGPVSIKGKIEFSDQLFFPNYFNSPGIMGPYSFAPFMECRHGVVAITQTLTGSLTINSKKKEFTGGKGYVEKDWGKSFPSSYLWLQCNNFGQEKDAFMFSAARVPYLGRTFTGFLGFLYWKGNLSRLASYNRWKVSNFALPSPLKCSLELKNRENLVIVQVTGKKPGDLKAPTRGEMDHYIKESINSKISIEYLRDGKLIYKADGKAGGFETKGDLSDLF